MLMGLMVVYLAYLLYHFITDQRYHRRVRLQEAAMAQQLAAGSPQTPVAFDATPAVDIDVSPTSSERT